MSGSGGKGNVQINGVKVGTGGGNDFYHVKLTFFISLLAWPIVFVFNNGFTTIEASVRLAKFTLRVNIIYK
jgi:hypothetical protein